MTSTVAAAASATTTTTSSPSSAAAPPSSMAFMSRSQSKKFPFKCHEMLAYAEKHGLEHIVSWLPGGKAFAVHDHEAFCKQVLKATFSHSNFKSFEKQLNNWGFKRSVVVGGGNGNGHHSSKSFSNPNFIRGRKSLCQTMTSKSTLKKAAEGKQRKQQSLASSNNQSTNAATTASSVAAHQATVLSAARQQQQQQQQALIAAGGYLNNGGLPFFGNHQAGGGNTNAHGLQMMLFLRHKQALLQNFQQQQQRQQQQQQQQAQTQTLNTTTTTKATSLTHSTNRVCGDEAREEDKERAAVLLALRRG